MKLPKIYKEFHKVVKNCPEKCPGPHLKVFIVPNVCKIILGHRINLYYPTTVQKSPVNRKKNQKNKKIPRKS